MKKIYFIDISRRLSLFILLLGCFVTQVAAQDNSYDFTLKLPTYKIYNQNMTAGDLADKIKTDILDRIKVKPNAGAGYAAKLTVTVGVYNAINNPVATTTELSSGNYYYKFFITEANIGGTRTITLEAEEESSLSQLAIVLAPNAPTTDKVTVHDAITITQDYTLQLADVSVVAGKPEAMYNAIQNSVLDGLNTLNGHAGLLFSDVTIVGQTTNDPLSVGEYNYSFKVTNKTNYPLTIVSAAITNGSINLVAGQTTNVARSTTTSPVRITKGTTKLAVTGPSVEYLPIIYGSVADEAALRNSIAALTGFSVTKDNVTISLMSNAGRSYTTKQVLPVGEYRVVLSPVMPSDQDFNITVTAKNCVQSNGTFILDKRYTVDPQSIGTLSVPNFLGTSALPASSSYDEVCDAIMAKLDRKLFSSVELCDNKMMPVTTVEQGKTYGYRIWVNSNYSGANTSFLGISPTLVSGNEKYIEVKNAVTLKKVIDLVLPKLSYTQASAPEENALKSELLEKLKAQNTSLMATGAQFTDLNIAWYDKAIKTYTYSFSIQAAANAPISVKYMGETGYATLDINGGAPSSTITAADQISVTTTLSEIGISLPTNAWTGIEYEFLILTKTVDLGVGVSIQGLPAGASFKTSRLTRAGNTISSSAGKPWEFSSRNWAVGSYDFTTELYIPKTAGTEYTFNLKNCEFINSQADANGTTYRFKSTVPFVVSEKLVASWSLPVFTGAGGALPGFTYADSRNTVLTAIDNKISISSALNWLTKAVVIDRIELFDANFSNAITGDVLAPGFTYSYRIYLTPNYTAKDVTFPISSATYNAATHSIDVSKAVVVDKPLQLKVYSNKSIQTTDPAAKSYGDLKTTILNSLKSQNTALGFDISVLTLTEQGNNADAAQVLPGTYTYTFNLTVGDKPVRFTTSPNVGTFDFLAKATKSITVSGQVVVGMATQNITITTPTSWTAYTYGDAGFLTKVKAKFASTPALPLKYSLLAEDGTLKYDDINEGTYPVAGKYKVQIAFNDALLEAFYNYDISVSNATPKDGAAGIYIVNAPLTVAQKAIPATVFPVFTDGGLGKIAAGTKVDAVLTQLSESTKGCEGVNGDKTAITQFIVYDKDNNPLDVDFALIAGETYSYEAVLNPNYKEGTNVSATVGGSGIVSFSKGVYRLTKSIETAKEKVTVKLPSFRGAHALKIGQYADVSAVTSMLAAQVMTINNKLFKSNNLVPTVTLKPNNLPVADGTVSYTVTLSGDNTSRYIFTFATNDDMASTALSPAASGLACTFNGGLEFLTILPTTKNIIVPTLSTDFVDGMTAADIVAKLKEQLLYTNPALLSSTSYTVTLLENTVSEATTSYGYKLTITKVRDLIDEVVVNNFDGNTMTLDNTKDPIEIIFHNAVTLTPRPVAKLKFEDVTIQYVKDLTDAEVAKQVKDQLTILNPKYATYIKDITIGGFAEMAGENATYKVTFKVGLDTYYSDATFNGKSLAKENRNYVYEGKLIVTPRPSLDVTFEKFSFNKQGATPALMQQHILSKLLVKNPNLKGAYISKVKVVATTDENIYNYKVFFEGTTKVRAINVKPAEVTTNRTIENGLVATYEGAITLTPGSGVILEEYPFVINATLPKYTAEFGKTAAKHAEAILESIQQVLVPQNPKVTVPVLEQWAAKVYLIKNTSAGEELILLDEKSYPKVSTEYGYQVVVDVNPVFADYFKMNYSAPAGTALEVFGTNENNVTFKLSSAVTKATNAALTSTSTTVVYSDENTLLNVQETIKNTLLADEANKRFFNFVSRTGVQPENSFTVAVANAPADGTLPAGEYAYTLTFVKEVTDNISFTNNAGKLNVNKAPVVFNFPGEGEVDPVHFDYGKKKTVIEAELLRQFIDLNADLLNTYKCFENAGDLFTVTLTGAVDVPVVGVYSYTVKVKEGLLGNFETTSFAEDLHTADEAVEVGLKTFRVTLPVYKGVVEGIESSRPAFVYGMKNIGEMEAIIVADIKVLNPKLADEVKVVWQPAGEKASDYPNIGTEYGYIVTISSTNYTYKFQIDTQASVETSKEGNVSKGISANAALIIPANVTDINFAKPQITGTWSISKNNVPAYATDLVVDTKDIYGYKLIQFKESEDPNKTIVEAEWNRLFKDGKLNWALSQNGKVVYSAPTLTGLDTYIKKNVTSGVFTLSIVEVSTLKSVVGNLDLIPLNQALATLTVKPALVAVNPAAEGYTKVYGTEVTTGDNLNTELTYALTPALNTSVLKDEVNVIDLFTTVGETSVYDAMAPCGTYTLQATADANVIANAFEPVIGVVFVPGEAQATVTVTPVEITNAKVNVSVSREYGEFFADSDVKVVIENQEDGNVSPEFKEEIEKILNTTVGRMAWIDTVGFNKKTNAGLYKTVLVGGVKAKMDDLLANYSVSGVTVRLDSIEIRKAPLTVKAKSYNRPYGTANPELEIEYFGLKNNEQENIKDVFEPGKIPAIKTDATAQTRGKSVIYFTEKGEAKNYAITNVEGWVSIDKVQREIVWPEDQRTLVIAVGETVELSATVKSADDNKLSISGLRYILTNNDRERVVLYQNEAGKMMIEGKVRTLDGPVTITAYADGDDTYSEAVPVSGTVEVVAPEGEAAQVNVIVSNVTSVYDGTPRAVNVKVEEKDGKETDYDVYYEGDQAAETVYPSSKNAPTDAGTYFVTVKVTSGASTYAYKAKNKMVIAPKAVTVKARSFEIMYGDAKPAYEKAFDYNRNDFLAGEDFDADKAPVVRADGYANKAGVYQLIPYSSQDFGRNYRVSYITGLLTVNKVPLTIQADNKESVYGKDLVELTYSCNGFVKGEELKHIGFAPRISSVVKKDSDAGTYPIVFDDSFESDNYDVTYKEGKYVVTPAEQKIAWNPNIKVKMGEEVVLNATASSKLPVSYMSDNDDVAYINQIGGSWILVPVSDGMVKVTAIQNGNKNYWAAQYKNVVFAVGEGAYSTDNEQIHYTDNIEVYPTLFTNSVTVTAPSAIKRIEVISYAGKLLKLFNRPSETINLSDLIVGHYLLNVVLEDGTTKCVKVTRK